MAKALKEIIMEVLESHQDRMLQAKEVTEIMKKNGQTASLMGVRKTLQKLYNAGEIARAGKGFRFDPFLFSLKPKVYSGADRVITVVAEKSFTSPDTTKEKFLQILEAIKIFPDKIQELTLACQKKDDEIRGLKLESHRQAEVIAELKHANNHLITQLEEGQKIIQEVKESIKELREQNQQSQNSAQINDQVAEVSEYFASVVISPKPKEQPLGYDGSL